MRPLANTLLAAIRKLIQNRAAYIVLVVWGLFFFLAWLMDPLDLRRTMDSARFGTAFVAFWVTSAVAALALWEGVRNRGDLVAISWALVWGTIAFQSVYIPTVREVPHLLPPFFQGQTVPSAIGYSYALSAMIFIFAVASGRSQPEKFGVSSWTFLLAATTTACASAGLVLGLMIGMGITGGG